MFFKNQIFFYFLFMVLITFMLFVLSFFFKKSKKKNPWSDHVFECGFESSTILPPPFSLHFFSITIVFLIFDLEVVILIPLLIVNSSHFTYMLKSMIMFIILIGLFIEWFDGSLDWEL